MDKINKITDELKFELTKLLKVNKSLQDLNDKYKLEKRDQFIDLILGIIEVIDTYERAQEVINERNLNKDENTKKIINRFNGVLKRLHKLLQRFGVTRLEFPENRLIIGFCKVVDTEPDSNLPNDIIIEIVRNGYIHGKELIREADVIIVKNQNFK